MFRSLFVSSPEEVPVSDEHDLDEDDFDWVQEERERERERDDRARRCRGDSAEQVLAAVVHRLTEKPGGWWAVGWIGEGHKGVEAQVYRTSRPQTLPLVGENDLAD